jgi:hypothetical protein
MVPVAPATSVPVQHGQPHGTRALGLGCALEHGRAELHGLPVEP